jgi:hypothetical protein
LATVFLEIVIETSDAAEAGFQARDEIEDPVADAFEEHDLGEVTGGGGGMGYWNIDVEIANESRFDEAIRLIRNTLAALMVPGSTRIVRYKPAKTAYNVYD